MRLICYTTSGLPLRIVPAPLERPWMDQTPNGNAYRCLPLNIANSHGWLILNPAPFVAIWNGGGAIDDIRVEPIGAPGAAPLVATSHFGNGVLTLLVNGLFRTEPGYDLWVGGPSNLVKDAIQPLTGVVETDWSPFTFTMNYKFTRPMLPISFGLDEPYCMIYPQPRGLVESVEPEFRSFDRDPEVRDAYAAWSDSRQRFSADLKVEGTAAHAQQWQKDYFKGASPWAQAPADHRTRIRLKEFK